MSINAPSQENPHYLVVKHAGPTWHHYWVENPQDGVCYCNSVHDTFTGINNEVKPFYLDYKEAKGVAENLNKVNPVGDYEVCPFNNTGCSICPLPKEN